MFRVAAIAVFLVYSTLVAGQTFSAIYQPTDLDIRTVVEGSWEAFVAENQQQQAAGYRLIDVETFRGAAGERNFVGTFTESPLPSALESTNGWTDFIALKRKMVNEGYTMIDVAAVPLNESDVRFFGVWVKEDNPTIHKVWLLDSQKTIVQKTREMANKRFKIKRVHVLDVPNGEPAFVVLYHFSPVDRFNFLYFADTREEFTKEYRERKGSQVELIDFDRFRTGDRERYVAVFQDGDYDSEFTTGRTLDGIRSAADSLTQARGLKLVNLSVD